MRELTLWRQVAGGGSNVEREIIPGVVAIVDDCYYRACCFREDGSPIYWRVGWRVGRVRVVRAMLDGRNIHLQHAVWLLAGRILPILPMTIDHISRDALDNQLNNLRELDPSGQRINRRLRMGGTSVYRGVCWHARDLKWQARVRKNRRLFHLGYYPTELETAFAYNLAAGVLHKELAQFNVIPAGVITPDRASEIWLKVSQIIGRS